MRKLINKIKTFKISNYLEIGNCPSETKW